MTDDILLQNEGKVYSSHIYSICFPGFLKSIEQMADKIAWSGLIIYQL